MYAVSASDDACQVHGGRGHTCLLPILTGRTSCCCNICPTRPRTHMFVAILTGGTSCCCDICPTRYTIRPMTSPIGVCARAGGCGQQTTPSVDCVALTLRLLCMWCCIAQPSPPTCAGAVVLFGGVWPEPRRHSRRHTSFEPQTAKRF